jgi:hypothetical protein
MRTPEFLTNYNSQLIYKDQSGEITHIYPYMYVLLLIGSHVILGVLMNTFQDISTLHAYIVLSAGLFCALLARNEEYILYILAYTCGSEVLWRMTEANVYWEFGKYTTILIAAIAICRKGLLASGFVPFSYMFLLLPSTLLTLELYSADEAKQQISFNLSGPLVLMVCYWFFSNLKLSTKQINLLLFSLILPILSIAGILLFTIAGATNLTFSSGSNIATSGGFGPNQVSSILGLGMLIAFLFVINDSFKRSFRIFIFISMILLGCGSAITFSRGGLLVSGTSAFIGSLFLFRDNRTRIKLIFVAIILSLLVSYVLVPWMDNFTEGTIITRFKDLNPTGRDKIALLDIQLWMDNPLFGSGPGGGAYHRSTQLTSAAHTEFTRMLGEHGIFGLISLILYLVMAIKSFKNATSIGSKALVSVFIIWSTLSMLHIAMRLVAPAFIFGLAGALLMTDLYKKDQNSNLGPYTR